MSLNPILSEKIIPINAAIGKDEQLKFYVSDDSDEYGSTGASFVSNNQNKNFKYELVDGYKLETARKKFGIKHIDLLKMDCKECEFYLTDEDLKDIDRIKLEYTIQNKKFKLDDLLDLLKRNGLSVQFSEMETLIDFQIELLEIFMQQKYEIIVFSSNNLLEMYKIY